KNGRTFPFHRGGNCGLRFDIPLQGGIKVQMAETGLGGLAVVDRATSGFGRDWELDRLRPVIAPAGVVRLRIAGDELPEGRDRTGGDLSIALERIWPGIAGQARFFHADLAVWIRAGH